jgi:hypothetical protein
VLHLLLFRTHSQWDEWDDFAADSASKGARLQLYINRPRSSSASSSGGSPWQTLHSSRLLNMGSWQPPTPTIDDDTGDMAACLTQHALDARVKAGSSAVQSRGGGGSAVGGAAAAAGSTKSSLRSSKSSSCAGSVVDAQSLVTSSSVRFAADVPSADVTAAVDTANAEQQCASCVSLKAAAALATIAEHAGSVVRHGSLTASSSVTIPHPVRRPPGRRQTSPDLKQIMRQLKVGWGGGGGSGHNRLNGMHALAPGLVSYKHFEYSAALNGRCTNTTGMVFGCGCSPYTSAAEIGTAATCCRCKWR